MDLTKSIGLSFNRDMVVTRVQPMGQGAVGGIVLESRILAVGANGFGAKITNVDGFTKYIWTAKRRGITKVSFVYDKPASGDADPTPSSSSSSSPPPATARVALAPLRGRPRRVRRRAPPVGAGRRNARGHRRPGKATTTAAAATAAPRRPRPPGAGPALSMSPEVTLKSTARGGAGLPRLSGPEVLPRSRTTSARTTSRTCATPTFCTRATSRSRR